MITFHYRVNPKQKRKDGTMNVKVIVTYKRKRKMLPTSIYCTQADLTRGGRLKNQQYIDAVEKVITEYQRRASTLGLEFNDMPLERIVEKLTERNSLDFFQFADKVVAKVKVPRTRMNYITSINHVEKFVGSRHLDFRLMTKDFFMRFETYLDERHGGLTSGDVLILTRVRTVYRKAQREFNDEGEERISSYPLIAYSIPRVPSVRKRALPIEAIRKIKDYPLSKSRQCICRDLFILSFCLMGMNAVDMYYADYTGGRICYRRTKTKRSRADGAYMEVDIDPRVMPLVERYRGTKKLFYFAERMSLEQFRRMIIRHTPNFGKVMGFDDLTFYSARHSFATIAYNDCGVDKYVVHSALNHVPQEMKITDVYIRRTFEKENNANKKVLDLLFE